MLYSASKMTGTFCIVTAHHQQINIFWYKTLSIQILSCEGTHSGKQEIMFKVQRHQVKLWSTDTNKYWLI